MTPCLGGIGNLTTERKHKKMRISRPKEHTILERNWKVQNWKKTPHLEGNVKHTFNRTAGMAEPSGETRPKAEHREGWGKRLNTQGAGASKHGYLCLQPTTATSALICSAALCRAARALFAALLCRSAPVSTAIAAWWDLMPCWVMGSGSHWCSRSTCSPSLV